MPVPFTQQKKLPEGSDVKRNIINSLYDKNVRGLYDEFAYIAQGFKDVGVLDLDFDIFNISKLDQFKYVALYLSYQDVWGLKSRTMLMRIRHDVIKFIQLLIDDEMKTDALRMVPVIKEHRKNLLWRVSYFREVFIQNIEDNDCSEYFNNIYYPVKRESEVPDNRIACRFLFQPLLVLVQRRSKAIESRYLNLLISDGIRITSIKAEIAASLMEAYASIRALGREIADKHDYLMLMSEEGEQRAGKIRTGYKREDVHDTAFEFYIGIIAVDEKLNKIGDKINLLTESESEFNLIMDADKINETKRMVTDDKFDFQILQMTSDAVKEDYDSLLETYSDVHETEVVEFIKLVYAFDIVHRGGMHVYQHPLLKSGGDVIGNKNKAGTDDQADDK